MRQSLTELSHIEFRRFYEYMIQYCTKILLPLALSRDIVRDKYGI